MLAAGDVAAVYFAALFGALFVALVVRMACKAVRHFIDSEELDQ
jgi:hypothetical protein